MTHTVSHPRRNPFRCVHCPPTHSRGRVKTGSHEHGWTSLQSELVSGRWGVMNGHCRFWPRQQKSAKERLLPIIHPFCLFSNFLGTDNCVCEVIRDQGCKREEYRLAETVTWGEALIRFSSLFSLLVGTGGWEELWAIFLCLLSFLQIKEFFFFFFLNFESSHIWASWSFGPEGFWKCV